MKYETPGVLTNAFFKEQIKYKIVEQRNRHFGDFHTSVDNYLEYVSIPIAYGLDVFGVKSKNDFLNSQVRYRQPEDYE